jgi:hypothetical protein
VRQLLLSLERTLASASTEQLGYALETTLTLQQLAASLPRAKLVLYPQLFWAAVALLHTPVPSPPPPTRERDGGFTRGVISG